MNWNDLTMAQKSELMGIYIKNGVTSLEDMRSHFNSFTLGEDKDNPDNPDNPPSPSNGNDRYNKRNGLIGFREKASASIMDFLRKKAGLGTPAVNLEDFRNHGGTAQATYLLDRDKQEEVFLRHGYIKGAPKDYGFTKDAVGNRDIPVYQTAPNADVNKENLVPMPREYTRDFVGSDIIKKEDELEHAGKYSFRKFIDSKTGKVYEQAWDLNDYGDVGYYGTVKDWFNRNILDRIGSPVVVTTGIQGMDDEREKRFRHSYQVLHDNANESYYSKPLIQGLQNYGLEFGEMGLQLPDVVIKGKALANGGPKNLPIVLPI